MKIAIIGAGNVATHLSEALQNAGYSIVQVYSRTEASARTLAEKLNCAFTIEISGISESADVYFYCVKDDVLPALIEKNQNNKAIHIHCSGSSSIEIFADSKDKFGVIYPLQTFSKNKKVNFSEIPLFIEASNNEALKKISLIANKISGKVYRADSSQRLKLHISAVFACNFVNYLYDVAENILREAELPFEVLLPLITETAEKIKHLSPFDAQTGPAVRFDNKIISKHFAALAGDSKKQQLYEEMSRQIYERHKKEE